MSQDEIHVGDVGTIFRGRVVDDKTGATIDVSNASVMLIIFDKPVTGRVEHTATHTTDGSDGYIEYSVIEGDLDIKGAWQVQLYVEGPGYVNSSVIRDFEVLPNISG